MNRIRIADTTLCSGNGTLTFKEKIEIARQLERLNVDCIELPEIQNARTDTLLIRTVSSFVKESALSVCAGMTKESIELAAAALSGCAKPRIRIELPLSSVGMEYLCHKKPGAMIEWIGEAVRFAKTLCADVEFCALDATRAEREHLERAIEVATEAGADAVTVCDDASQMLPDDFSALIGALCKDRVQSIGVRCSDKNGMACANAILAARCGATTVKTAVGGEIAPLDVFASLVQNCGERYGISTRMNLTELHRNVGQISWILSGAKNDKNAVSLSSADAEGIHLDAKDDEQTVCAAAAKLGYDLSEEDCAHVYEEFLRVAAKKNVGAKDLEAIIASVALQVPPTYRLVSYVINNGNIISASAQITLEKDGAPTTGVCIGDGPIDAAFLALEQILGQHYELDDFQIQSVTEGKEAMGSALVKLRFEGKLYSGNGISTDIIGAAIRAYLNAVNKIVYEEVAG
ncbi:MAG: hypothetical protein IKB75_02550 [Clostridia bacterium]|nr:hypothetical protein [Clostridia bacterium]